VVGPDGVRFQLDGGGEGAVVRTAEGTLQISFTRAGANRARVGFACSDDERFLGFGAMPMDVEHRGATVPLWVSEQGIGRVPTDEPSGDWFFRGTRHQSYFPVPFFLSSRNYGVRGDTAYKSVYAMCSEADDVWRVEAWEGTVSFHLLYGDRPLDVTGIPGHHETSVAVFDTQTGSLFTGDTVYPGRLYAADPLDFLASLERLVDFAADRPVQRVLGCHIEMGRDGSDFPVGCRHQPDEVPLPLSPTDLVTIRDATRAAGGRSGVYPAGPALLWNGPCRRATARQLARLLIGRLRGSA